MKELVDLSCILLQGANKKKGGQDLGGQFHTNHCILCPLQPPYRGGIVCVSQRPIQLP